MMLSITARGAHRMATTGAGVQRFVALIAALALAGCMSAKAIPPAPGDCATIRLWSNGWHASLALPAETFSEDHPLRTLFPDKRYFLIGWGARDFYMTEQAGVLEGIKAVLPPTRSAIHIIAGDAPVEDALWRPRHLMEFAVSQSALSAMQEKIAASLDYDEAGAPVIVGEGRVAGASYFLASKGGFHLFSMCNHWTARRLGEAGVPVNAGISFTAAGLFNAVERLAPPSCPESGEHF